jgi:hypothetical protein
VDQGSPRTEAPEAPPGVASPPPFGFTVVLWLGAFFAIAWGFRVLFAPRGAPYAGDHGPGPDGEDVTLEEPRPDRS